MTIRKPAIYAMTVVSLLSLGLFFLSTPSFAQSKIRKDSLEKSSFYKSPREFQIIDDRPIVHDFREAPQEPGSIDLPPGPQGGGGPGGGGGAGALGGGPGSSIPAGGMHIGGPQGYRTNPDPLGALPKSGFGGTNIPARGMGPRGALPGVTQGVIGKLMNQNTRPGTGAGPARSMGPSVGRSNGNSNAAPVATYGGGSGYGSGSAYGGSASHTDAQVRGSLLRH